ASATELVVEEAIGADETAVAGCSIKTAYNELRFTGESLKQETSVEESNEIRDDRQVADVKRSSVRAGGDINFELSYGALDDLLEAALMSADWSTEVEDTQTTFSMVASDNSINDSGSGFVTAGFLANQWVKISGFTTAANNGYFKIVSVAAGKMVLAGGTVADESAGDSVTITMGPQIVNGTTERFFSIERGYKDIAKYAIYSGMEVSGMSLAVAAGGLVTGGFSFMGKDETSSASSYSKGTAQAADANDVMSAVDEVQSILEGMASQSVKELSLSIANNLRERMVVGEVGPESLGAGRLAVSGSFQIYLADSTLLDKYLNQTASSLAVIFEDAAGNAYVVDFPQIRYSGGERVAGGKDTDIMAAVSFAAYRDETEDVTVRIARFAA
ncbi:MAG: phage tail tube protein, partial [Planctomycetota bacterium]